MDLPDPLFYRYWSLALHQLGGNKELVANSSSSAKALALRLSLFTWKRSEWELWEKSFLRTRVGP